MAVKEDFASMVAAVGKAMKDGGLLVVEHPRFGKFTALSPLEQAQASVFTASPPAPVVRGMDPELKKIIDENIHDPMSDAATHTGGLPGFRIYTEE